MSALLLVDIQYDFISGSLAVPEAAQILVHTYSLLDDHKWDLIIASQASQIRLIHEDHHPPGHVSFASRHGVEPFTTRTVAVPGSRDTKEQEMWPDHCVQGTRGAEIEDGVRDRVEKLGGVVVRKGEDTEVDAYSAFETRCTGAHADQSQVAKLLTDHAITNLYVVGLATDFCVRASVLAALEAAAQAGQPWTVTVVREGCRGVDGAKSQRVLEELEVAGARAVSIEDEEVRSL